MAFAPNNFQKVNVKVNAKVNANQQKILACLKNLFLRFPGAGSFCIVFFRFQHRRRSCFSS